MADLMLLPAAVAAALGGSPVVGVAEQALPLLTTDDGGQPRAMLVSRAETAVAEGGGGVHIVLRPSTSRANIHRTGLATLLVVTGDALHSVRLRRTRHVEAEALHAIAFAVTGLKADSVGIPLQPTGYIPTEELAALEHWRASAALLARLAGSGSAGSVTAGSGGAGSGRG